MSEVYKDGTIVLDTPKDIEAFRLLSLRSQLKIQVVTGMTCRAPITNYIRDVLGVTTKNKKKLLEQFTAHLMKLGILNDKSPGL